MYYIDKNCHKAVLLLEAQNNHSCLRLSEETSSHESKRTDKGACIKLIILFQYNIALENLECWDEYRCYFDTYHPRKHCGKTSTLQQPHENTTPLPCRTKIPAPNSPHRSLIKQPPNAMQQPPSRPSKTRHLHTSPQRLKFFQQHNKYQARGIGSIFNHKTPIFSEHYTFFPLNVTCTVLTGLWVYSREQVNMQSMVLTASEREAQIPLETKQHVCTLKSGRSSE